MTNDVITLSQCAFRLLVELVRLDVGMERALDLAHAYESDPHAAWKNGDVESFSSAMVYVFETEYDKWVASLPDQDNYSDVSKFVRFLGIDARDAEHWIDALRPPHGHWTIKNQLRLYVQFACSYDY